MSDYMMGSQLVENIWSFIPTDIREKCNIYDYDRNPRYKLPMKTNSDRT